MEFSTYFKKSINTRVGGLWGNRFNTQIVLDSEPNNDCSLTINAEHIKCNFTVNNNDQISNKKINDLVESFLFEINKLNKKDYYKCSEILNILCSTLLGHEQFNDELLTAVLNNETDVDEYVYDETDCE